MSSIITVHNLDFRYAKDKPFVLSEVNVEIEENSITAIAGLSGCGKTTLALALTGIIPKSLSGIISGDILIEDQNIQKMNLSDISKKIGLVFQEVDNQLFLPTVEAEIAFAPENFCRPFDEIESIINQTLQLLEIEHLRHKNPSLLSGGEKHLVAMAGVLSMNPQIIILDEIMSGLDESNKKLVTDTIKHLRDLGKTIIFIDHNIDNLMIADYIFLMKTGRIDDKIKGDMDDELLYNKLTDFFLSQI